MTTYSFKDVNFTIKHSLVGQKNLDGTGVGRIVVAFTDDNTDSDLGSDGNVMVDKIQSKRGTVTLEIQQTASLNKWLTNCYNTVYNAATSYWAGITITVEEKYDNGINTTATGCAFRKRPDRTDDQKGGRVTWEFMSANITQS